MSRGRYVDGHMTVPTLGIYGERDILIGDDCFESARPHTDSLRIERIPGAAHFIPEEVRTKSYGCWSRSSAKVVPGCGLRRRRTGRQRSRKSR